LIVTPKDPVQPAPPFRVALFLSELSGGGAERVLVNVASWLVNQNNVQVTLVCLKKEGPLVADLPPHLPVEELGASGVFTGILPLGRFLRRERIDLLLSTQFHNNLAAVLACRLFAPACKLILRESNTPSLHNRPKRDPWPKRLRKGFASLISGILYRKADGYIAVSEGVRRDMASYYRVEPDRIRVIPNPVTGPELEQQMAEPLSWPFPKGWEVLQQPRAKGIAAGLPGEPEGRAEAIEDERPLLIVTAGRVTRQKGHDLLIESFARAWNGARKMDPPRMLKLIILGRYEESDPWYQHLKDLVRLRGLEDEVAWAGYQPNPFPFFRLADLFVLSSHREGLPGSLIQALACGTPVVSTDCPNGPSEILEEGRWGELVPPGDSRSLAAAICRALTKPVATGDLMKRAAYWSSPLRAADYLSYMEEVAGR